MNYLIKRFKEDLLLAGYAKRSIDFYVSSVLRLHRFYNNSLEDITEEELRQYWLGTTEPDLDMGQFSPIAATFFLSFLFQLISFLNQGLVLSTHFVRLRTNPYFVIIRCFYQCQFIESISYFCGVF